MVFYAKEQPAKSCQPGEGSGVFRDAQVREVTESPLRVFPSEGEPRNPRSDNNKGDICFFYNLSAKQAFLLICH